jgi:hypothetical protein
MRVDQHTQWLVHSRGQRIAELPRQTRILLGIDNEESIRRFDCTGVGITARSDPGMDIGRDGHKLRFAAHRVSLYNIAAAQRRNGAMRARMI